MTKREYFKVATFAMLAFLIFILIFLFTAGPTFIDIIAHRKYSTPGIKITPEVEAFHRTLWVADMHSDAMLWRRNFLARNNYGHVDLPRMQEGSMALQFFTSPTKTPFFLNYDRNGSDSDMITALMMMQHNPVKTWFSLVERAIMHSRRLHDYAKNSKDVFFVIHSKAELAQFIEKKKANPSLAAGIMGLEGAHALEGDLNNIERLYREGFRMLAPVHFFDNSLGGSAHGLEKKGLTESGRRFVLEANRKDIIIDLSHASEMLIDDVLAISVKPVVLSHTGVKATCPNGRNISDKHARLIGQKNGLIGIAFFSQATCGKDIASIVRAIKKAVELAGVDHVALGSDFDGVVRTPIDAAGMKYLTAALLESGMNRESVRKIMGGNTLRFLQQNLPVR